MMIGPSNSGSLEPTYPVSSPQPPLSQAPSESELASSGTVAPPPPLKTVSGLMNKIDEILDEHQLSRNQQRPQESFQISMHFKRPADDPSGVLMKTWEFKQTVDGKETSKLLYSFPMEIEVSFKDGKPPVKFEYIFQTDMEVPDAPPRPAIINGEEVKNLLPTTTAGARKQAMYKAYLHACAFRSLIKASTNSQDPHYDLAKMKVETFIRTDSPIFYLSPQIEDMSKRFEVTYKRLKARNLGQIGVGSANDQNPFFIDFSERVVKTSKIAGKTFANAAQKHSRTRLQLDTDDPGAQVLEKASRLVPPTNPKAIPAFKEQLEKEDVNPGALVRYWPECIESDYERFQEKSKAFMNFPEKLLSFGTIRNLFMRVFLQSTGTSKLRKLKSEIERYEKDLDEDRLPPASKKNPRSRLGRLQKNKGLLALQQQASQDKLNEFRLGILNLKRPPDSRLDLETFYSLPPGGAALIDEEWKATEPNLKPEEKQQWAELQAKAEVNAEALEKAEREFKEWKRLLLNTHRHFKSEFEELKELSESISARMDWLNKEIPEEVWDGLGKSNDIRENIFRIYKLTAHVPSRLNKIQGTFQPRNDAIAEIENAN
ncbi:hypothetical protein [Parachlamydia sp. AcF125]|uniref:hypothetical protein n=1 Tax=Parachlamydia sp. AcF125 TaxID=2795736 RepID=UPI001BCA0742|nr:hypothetical protein [Parachlamydia sp. AcF125]MBS4168104.1 hypothetical protein [Parachlamydia sp. AcF125]